MAPVPHAGTNSEFGSKFELTFTSPSNDGLGAGVVAGGVAGAVGEAGDVGLSFACPAAAADVPLAETLQPVRTANSIIDAASVFKLVFKLEMTPLRV